MTAINIQKSNRFAFLDFLRILAALAVVGYHFTAFNTAWPAATSELFPSLSRVTKYGALGVNLFFVISGFVILMSIHGRTIQAYATSRISRIFPAFWFAVLFGSVLYTFLWPEGKNISLGQFLTNLTMTNSAAGIPHVDGVFWTLWVELRFYILAGVFLLWGITPQRILTVAFLWPLVGLIAIQQKSELLMILLIPGEAPLFAGGMVIYLMYRWGFSITSLLALLFNAFHAANHSTGWLATAMRNNTGQGINDNYMIIGVLLIFVIVALAVLTPIRQVNAYWMTWLGLFTYPLYLMHEAFGWYIITKTSDTYGTHVVLGITLAAVILLSYLVLRFIDQPGGRWLRRRVQKDLERLESATQS